MIDLRLLRENPDAVRASQRARGEDPGLVDVPDDRRQLPQPDLDRRLVAALARHDLRLLLGIDAEPVETLVTRWGGGLPQYAVGHVDRVARIRAAVAAVPGLAVCGASYDGVGIPACIASATKATAQVLASGRTSPRITMLPGTTMDS